MKIKKYILMLGVGLALLNTSCTDDYESVPLEQFTLDFVFSETDSLGVQAHQYLNSVYSQMQNGHNRVGGDYLDAATDDAISSSLTENDVYKLATGQYTSASQIGSDMRWNQYYEGIRTATTFITNIDKVPLMDTFNDGQPLNRAWKSEARFIRALHYFELIKRYGGVPVLGDHVYQLGEDIELPRNTFEECVEYIVSELDAIKDSLRTAPIADLSTKGHVVTREAALALKARVLLYAASPLFNGGNINATNPLTGYTDYSADRWKLAADAAKSFIDNNSYFQLLPEFDKVFIEDANREIIFFRQGGNGRSIETTNGPVGFSSQNLGNGRTSPSQNLVDAFPMLDGRSIIDTSSAYRYDPSAMYQNRDPRLKKTVLHNGASWLNTSLETFDGGVNNPDGATQKTKTSYYLRKFMGPFENEANYYDVRHNWISFRYAEVLLNFAEAQNEYAGATDEVYQVIKDLRARAGIESGNDGMYGLTPGMSTEEMRAIIQNERRIELAFEEHRYWDIRRWKIAEEVFNEPVEGLVIIKSGGAMIPNFVDVLSTTFQERQYLYPIPYSEVIKNQNMVQNPGWE
ncbi:RagB/SusD family nutrient uptake outer membrane protein [uncultured Draconibacterium sp.]|uniref:RagB/SusD family nutrient uptake outer membrane protein n=1 Tax=uncultured Draconibacterium sp. TaxID=1573823 RepID=UPI0029C91730|nr:RagB/SusD family nutrient uptake outer membrane protein [uncultured Draconibacterium sp.]